MTHADIISVIEAYASPTLQESWDNTGWQVTPSGTTDLCTGVITCLDITPAVVDEARAKAERAYEKLRVNVLPRSK